jgi:hypothetical protein
MEVDGAGDQDGSVSGRAVAADLASSFGHHPVQQRVAENVGDHRTQLVGPRAGVAAQEGSQQLAAVMALR